MLQVCKEDDVLSTDEVASLSTETIKQLVVMKLEKHERKGCLLMLYHGNIIE